MTILHGRDSLLDLEQLRLDFLILPGFFNLPLQIADLTAHFRHNILETQKVVIDFLKLF